MIRRCASVAVSSPSLLCCKAFWSLQKLSSDCFMIITATVLARGRLRGTRSAEGAVVVATAAMLADLLLVGQADVLRVLVLSFQHLRAGAYAARRLPR